MREFFYCTNPFLWLAVFFAVLYGVYGYLETRKQQKHEMVRQVWFNAVGGFTGGIALYYLWNADLREPKIADFVKLAIAFFGITGNLPYVALMRGKGGGG